MLSFGKACATTKERTSEVLPSGVRFVPCDCIVTCAFRWFNVPYAFSHPFHPHLYILSISSYRRLGRLCCCAPGIGTKEYTVERGCPPYANVTTTLEIDSKVLCTHCWWSWHRLRNHVRRRAAGRCRRMAIYGLLIVTSPVRPAVSHWLALILLHFMLWWVWRIMLRRRIGRARLSYRWIYWDFSVRSHTV